MVVREIIHNYGLNSGEWNILIYPDWFNHQRAFCLNMVLSTFEGLPVPFFVKKKKLGEKNDLTGHQSPLNAMWYMNHGKWFYEM